MQRSHEEDGEEEENDQKKFLSVNASHNLFGV
jgi:hypothetical protein